MATRGRQLQREQTLEQVRTNMRSVRAGVWKGKSAGDQHARLLWTLAEAITSLTDVIEGIDLDLRNPRGGRP